MKAPGDIGRVTSDASYLTVGEMKRLLENPDNWARLQWRVDRGVFVEALDGVRATRNEVMHFSADPLSEQDVARLRNFNTWLQVLDPRT